MYLPSRMEVPQTGWTYEGSMGSPGKKYKAGSFRHLLNEVYKDHLGGLSRSQVADDIEEDICKRAPAGYCVGVRGLGDVVGMIAQPIASALDAALGTSIKKCGGCQKRREKLNKLVKFQ